MYVVAFVVIYSDTGSWDMLLISPIDFNIGIHKINILLKCDLKSSSKSNRKCIIHFQNSTIIINTASQKNLKSLV